MQFVNYVLVAIIWGCIGALMGETLGRRAERARIVGLVERHPWPAVAHVAVVHLLERILKKIRGE